MTCLYEAKDTNTANAISIYSTLIANVNRVASAASAGETRTPLGDGAEVWLTADHVIEILNSNHYVVGPHCDNGRTLYLVQSLHTLGTVAYVLPAVASEVLRRKDKSNLMEVDFYMMGKPVLSMSKPTSSPPCTRPDRVWHSMSMTLP